MEPLRHYPVNHHAPKVTVDYGPTEAQIRQNRRKALARPNLLRTIIRLFTLAVGLSVLVVLAQSTIVWYTTKDDILKQPDGFRMPGWPRGMNLIPTYLMLAVAAIAIIVQILAALTLIGGIRRLRESQLHTWTVFATSTMGIVIWIAAAVYFKLQDNWGPGNWTLWSWSCKHKHLTNGKMSCESMCVKLNYVFYAAIIVGLLELVSLVLFGIKLRKIKRQGAQYTKITVEAR